MGSARGVVEYLARSAHRFEVLNAVCNQPRSRDEIRALTDASRVTVGRIIADLEEREWIVRDGHEYTTTAYGRFVAAEFGRVVENISAFQSLPPVTEWLPENQPAFDLARLGDGTVTTANEGDLIAPIRRALGLIERSDHLRVIANGASSEFVTAIADAVASGQTHTLIVPPETITALIGDEEMRSAIRSILESEDGTIYGYDGKVELPVIQIGDDRVALCSGDHQAMIETDDVVVYEWAVSYFDSLRSNSTPVSADAFSEAIRADTAFVE